MKITKNSSKKEIRKEYDQSEIKYGTLGVAEVFEEKLYEIAEETAPGCEDIMEFIEEEIKNEIWSDKSEFKDLEDLITSKIQQMEDEK